MKVINGKFYKSGWLVGNFDPAIVKSKDIEIAVQKFKAGTIGPRHYHKKATEYNYILSGKVRIDGTEFGEDIIFVYEPMNISEVEFLEDTELLVIKTPSDPNDKYNV